MPAAVPLSEFHSAEALPTTMLKPQPAPTTAELALSTALSSSPIAGGTPTPASKRGGGGEHFAAQAGLAQSTLLSSPLHASSTRAQFVDAGARLKALLANTLTHKLPTDADRAPTPSVVSPMYMEEKQQRRILELEKEVRTLKASVFEANALADSVSASLSGARLKEEEAEKERSTLLAEAEMRKADAIAQSQVGKELARKQRKLEDLLTKVEATYEVGQAR